MNKDYTRRFLLDSTDIRGEITTLEHSFQEAHSHQTFPSSLKPLFGQFLAGASLLSEVLKFEGILTLQAKGDGDVALIMAETNHQGHTRGIIRMKETGDDPGHSEDVDSSVPLPQLLGNGHLVITIDPEKGERYQGIIALEEDSLADCLTQYFANSEQLETYVKLFADSEKAGGIFLQCLPPQEVTDEETREDHWNTAKQLASTCTEEELFTVDHETLLFRLFNEFSCRVFEPKAIVHRCNCSRERSQNALVSIGQQEAYQLIKERDIIDIDCQFCGQRYTFSEEDLSAIFLENQSYH